MKESADSSGTSPNPFAEQFESEEVVHDRRPGQPVHTCFEAKPTSALLALLFADLPHPSMSDTIESDAAEEEEPETCEDREAA